MDPALATAISREVRLLVGTLGTRRKFATAVHVGHPASEQVRLPVQADLDAGLCADLVERALDGLRVTEGACGWVTRSGELSRTDADATWFAAARAAFGAHDLALPAFFVLNRTGWLDLVSGELRQWVRVRPATPAPRPR